MLKALEAHATFHNEDGSMTWDDGMQCYIMDMNGLHLFIDRFKEMDGDPALIRIYQTFEAFDKSFDVMMGAISSHDWFVEIPEEGEQ